MKISFGHAAARWFDVAERESTHATRGHARDPLTSWEAADHVVGLFVESGMKAVMIHRKWVTADSSGDFPRPSSGPRPHVDELWDEFLSHLRGRDGNDMQRRLSAQKGSPPVAVFKGWRAEHRYAPDGTVTKASVEERFAFAKRLKSILQDEGL